MDVTQIQNLIGWVIGVFAVGVISLIGGYLQVRRAGKMLSRDVRGADLTNESKEVDVATAWKGLATQTALETLEINKRLKGLEDKVEEQDDLICEQSKKILELENKVLEQDGIIAQQAIRIDEQDTEITLLKCELGNAREYNAGLIQQLKNNQIIPIDEIITQKEDCSKINGKKNKGAR